MYKNCNLPLNKLKQSGLKCNIEEFFFGKTKMEYLGFCVTRYGVKTLDNTILKIENIISLTTHKGVCKFIGILNNYLDIWARGSRKLYTSTNLTPS